MARGTNISINTTIIGEVSAQASTLGSGMEGTREELRAMQKELSEVLKLPGDYYGVCWEDAIPTARLKSQQSKMEEIVSLLAQAEQLAQDANNKLNTETNALKLAVAAMGGLTGAAYTTAVSIITQGLTGEADCGDNWAYVGTGVFAPLSGTPKVTSPYGKRNLYGSFHYGIDFGVKEGTQVYAPVSGTVIKAYTQTGGGNCVYFLGDDGYLYEFAHLSKFQCKTGDRVEAGDKLALSGKTGQYVTGPHLHLGVYKASQALNSKNKIVWKKTSAGDWYIPGSVDPEKHFSENYQIEF